MIILYLTACFVLAFFAGVAFSGWQIRRLLDKYPMFAPPTTKSETDKSDGKRFWRIPVSGFKTFCDENKKTGGAK